MITTSDVVKDIIRRYPIMEDLLADGILNLSAFARKIQPEVQERLMKDTSEAAIVMALKRLAPKITLSSVTPTKLKSFGGTITVRSNLVEFVVANSPTMLPAQAKLLKKADSKREFMNITRGLFETTFVVSEEFGDEIISALNEEKIVLHIENLAAVTVHFKEETIYTAGVYYRILKALAWEKINFVEIISSGEEVTIVFEQDVVDQAFTAIKTIVE